MNGSWVRQCYLFLRMYINYCVCFIVCYYLFTILDNSSALEYSIIRLLPEDIVCKITQRNNIRRANTCDPALKLLNEEITSDIPKHKQNIWKEHLAAHWDHRHDTHNLWKTIHGLSSQSSTSNHTQQLYHIQQQNNKHTQTYCQLFHQTIHKHCQTRNTQNKQIH